jgi:signal transduction histidine kinase
MWHTIKVLKRPFSGEVRNRRKNGAIYIANAVISPILDSRKKLIGFIGTEEDITQIKEVDRMKTEFISIAAHQLRTPLTSIIWNLDILANDTGRVTKEQVGIITNIKDSAEALNGLVNSLLNISRIEMGRLAVEPEQIDLNKLAGMVVKEFEVSYKQKNRKWNFCRRAD